jgi:hypothetical protein
MTLHDHLHIQAIFSAAERYRKGDASIVDLQRFISATASAMEGDVPKEVREAAYKLDAEIDSIRFSVSASEQPKRVQEVFRDFERTVSHYG